MHISMISEITESRGWQKSQKWKDSHTTSWQLKT